MLLPSYIPVSVTASSCRQACVAVRNHASGKPVLLIAQHICSNRLCVVSDDVSLFKTILMENQSRCEDVSVRLAVTVTKTVCGIAGQLGNRTCTEGILRLAATGKGTCGLATGDCITRIIEVVPLHVYCQLL
jgi:hypothetical protein